MEAFHPTKGTVPKNIQVELLFIHGYRFHDQRRLAATYKGTSYTSHGAYLTLETPIYRLILPLSKIAWYRTLQASQ